MIALDFVENLSGRFVEQDLIGSDEISELKAALKRHLEDPRHLRHLPVQAWGRKPT
jgi:hypothetical protein